MKSKTSPLIPTVALALGAAFLLTPNALAQDKKTTLDSTDQRFIRSEAAAGVAEVKIAKLGVKRAQRADIKAFAGKIATDHTAANAELAALAESKGLVLTSEIDRKHAETYEKLEEASDTDFDKEFLSVVVRDHKKCVKNFEAAAEDANDDDVKTWASKMLPTLQAHLEESEQLSAGSPAKETTEPDNTARNKRDRNADTLTPLDQGNSKADIATTAQIRREILKLDGISVNGRNVKIITNNGHVALRGPVNSAEEKTLIGQIAIRLVTSEHTDNQLEVQGSDPAK